MVTMAKAPCQFLDAVMLTLDRGDLLLLRGRFHGRLDRWIVDHET
jgi:hypothetical protein